MEASYMINVASKIRSKLACYCDLQMCHIHLGFIYVSWFIALQTLGISQALTAIKSVLVLLIRWPSEVPELEGWLPGESTRLLHGWKLQSHAVASGRKEELKVASITDDQWWNQPCLCNEAIMKTQEAGFREPLALGTWGLGRAMHAERAISSIWLISFFFN